jgi:predicted ATPase
LEFIKEMKMITKLKINNFKSWRTTGDIKLSKLTGFFGTNSSGKTSLLQHLLLLKQTTESADRAQVLDFGTEKSYLELGTFKDIIINHDITKAMEFEIDWCLEYPYRIADPEKKGVTIFEGKDLGFKADIRQTPKGRVFVENISYIFDNFRFQMQKKKKDEYIYKLSAVPLNYNEKNRKFSFARTPGRAWDLPSPIKFYGFPDQVKAYYKNAGFLSDFQLKFEELFSRIYYLGPLRDYPKRQYVWAGAQPTDMGRRGEQVIDAMMVSRERGETISRGRGRGRKKITVEEYVAYWLRELELIHEFRVHPIIEGGNLYQVKVKLTSKSPEVLITDVGFGVSQILPVITLCYYVPKGSTLLIEQPEIHLHPKVQAGLADVFIDAIKNKNIRIILESHSEHLLRRLQRRIAEQDFEHKDASLYFCEPIKGESQLRKLEMDLFGNIQNWPENFFGDEMGELAAMSEAIYKRKNNE